MAKKKKKVFVKKKRATLAEAKSGENKKVDEEEEEKKKKKKDDDKPLSLKEVRAVKYAAHAGAVIKKYGSTAIRPASVAISAGIPRISTGILMLDYALNGGWPRGRISVVWGDRSSGKTTTLLRSIGIAQKMDVLTNKFLWELPDSEDKMPLKVGYVDVERALDSDWARNLGVDLDAMDYSAPVTQEEAGNIIESHIMSGAVDLVIVDSLAAMTPEDELKGGVEDMTVGLAARINNKILRKSQAGMNMISRDMKTFPTMIMVNQTRSKIGNKGWGDPDVKPGGKGQDFFSSIEVKFESGKTEYYDTDKMLPRWGEYRFKVLKSKVGPPQIHGSYQMQLADDPDHAKQTQILDGSEVLDAAKKFGIFRQEGGKWIMYGESFKTKGDMLQEFLYNTEKSLMLKRDIISRFCPKQ